MRESAKDRYRPTEEKTMGRGTMQTSDARPWYWKGEKAKRGHEPAGRSLLKPKRGKGGDVRIPRVED